MYEGSLRIMRSTSIDEFAQESLACLVALVPCKQCMLFVFDDYVPGNVKFGQFYQYGSTVHYLDTFINGPYMDVDWIFNRMNLKAADCAFRDSDIIDQESLENLRVYKDIYQKEDVHWGMRVNMTENGKLRGSYTLFRSKSEGDFSDVELLVCNKLARLFAIRFNQLQHELVEENRLSRDEAMDRYGLTIREYQVAELAALGGADEEIAERLSISPSTARKHLYNAYSKLGVNKRSQLETLFSNKSM